MSPGGNITLYYQRAAPLSRASIRYFHILAYLFGEGLDPALVAMSRPLCENAIADFAWYDVEIQIVRDLPGGFAVVAQDVIAVRLDRCGHGPGDPAQPGGRLSHRLRRARINSRAVPLGNHERVAVADGSNVQERQHRLILVHFRDGDLAGHHPAKQTSIHAVIPPLCSVLLPVVFLVFFKGSSSPRS